MKTKFKLSIKEIILICIFLFCILWIIILSILKNYQDICEAYVVNFSSKIVSLISRINSVFPFSLTEICILFYVIIAITCVVLFIVFMVKKRFRSGIHILGSGMCYALVIVTCYISLTSLNYNRAEINLPQYEEEVSNDQFNEIVTYFIDDFNYCSSKLNYLDDGMVEIPYTFDELNQILKEEYHRLDDNDYFASYTPNCKPLISSYIFSELHISGMSFSITGEANINMLNVNYDYAFTMAHEIAHQKGVMREEDANLTALYICLFSDDVYLRYSAYTNTIYSMLNLLNYTGIENNYIEVYYTIDRAILTDWSVSSAYINSFELLGNIGEFFNNIYLKLFGNEGTSAYVDVTTVIDTGEVDEVGNIIYDIEFSPYQKMYFYKYFNY